MFNRRSFLRRVPAAIATSLLLGRQDLVGMDTRRPATDKPRPVPPMPATDKATAADADLHLIRQAESAPMTAISLAYPIYSSSACNPTPWILGPVRVVPFPDANASPPHVQLGYWNPLSARFVNGQPT